MADLIILTTEPENWVPKQLEAKAKEKDIDVEVINPDNAYISLSEDPFISYDGTRFTGAKVCIPRLSEENLDYKVAIIDHLEKMDVKVINKGRSLRAASNKVETQILLNNAGLKTPKTAVFTCEEQLEKAIEAIGGNFPVIVKTIYGTHGVGVIRADSLPSARSIVQQLSKSGEQFMVQEYIEHSESARILLLNGECLASVMRSIPDGDFRSNAHQGSELKVHEASEQELQAVKKAAEVLQINLAAVDYILHEDEVIILEVNGSPGFEAMQKVVDVDIAKKIIEYCSSLIGSGESSNEQPLENEPEELPTEVEVEITVDDKELPADEDEQAIEVDNDEVVEVPTHDVDNDKIVGTVTHVVIKHFNDEQPIEARVDTGAKLSSIHGTDIVVDDTSVKFRFQNTIYKFHLLKTMKVRQSDSEESQSRPVIRVDMVIDGQVVRNVDVTVTERDHMKYDLLLGRETLAAAGVLVNPAAEVISSAEVNSSSQGEEE